MWPFKKRNSQQTLQEAKVILCIPGNWNNFEHFQESLIVTSGAQYMVVADMLISGERQRHYKLEFCDRDDKMKASFAVAGKVTGMTESFLDEIAQHKHVVYIIGETGSLQDAENIAYAGNAILKAGGTGIKIESAGKAFDKKKWADFFDRFEPHLLYKMFVLDSITDEDGTVFSCGMQNLGLKDTIISGEEFQYAVDLIILFGYYQIIDKPVIMNGQTFRKNMESPIFRITAEAQPRYQDHETFANPFGMWRLSRIQQ